MDCAAPPELIAIALAELRKAAGLEGAAVIDLSDDLAGPTLVQEAGLGGPEILATAAELMFKTPRLPSHGSSPGRRPLLAFPWTLPPGRFGGLALWRMPGARAWTAANHGTATIAASLIRVILEHGPGEIGLDRLTGLPNRAYFLEEVDRHIERLDLDAASGTMMLIDLDGLERLNRQHGREAGDRILGRTATLLRAMVRPTDIVARTGGDEFALWLDGMDHMTAAERAESIGQRRLAVSESDAAGPELRQTLSIGIASRPPGSTEDAAALLRRAHAALQAVKAGGGAGWRVAHAVAQR